MKTLFFIVLFLFASTTLGDPPKHYPPTSPPKHNVTPAPKHNMSPTPNYRHNVTPNYIIPNRNMSIFITPPYYNYNYYPYYNDYNYYNYSYPYYYPPVVVPYWRYYGPRTIWGY